MDISASHIPTSSLAISSPSTSQLPPHVTPSVPPHRLLYRGALSLPDSLLLLDGLSFTLPPTSSSPLSSGPDQMKDLVVSDVLNNPLALSLESMRGRPSLHLVGVENCIDDLVLESGAVCV